MFADNSIEVATFYKFTDLSRCDLSGVKLRLLTTMREFDITGTIIIASEGFNAGIAGTREAIPRFIATCSEILSTSIKYRSTFHDLSPYKRAKVKIKREIVTLGLPVDISLGRETHVHPKDWNELISRDDVYILDTRNDYEYRTGTFDGAVNPGTVKFSELPDFIATNGELGKNRDIAMFCTGGIRCEKFAPYLRSLGFENVFQLEGGILNYLETVPKEEQRWQGECFVFDERVSLSNDLRKGASDDLSLTPQFGADETPVQGDQ